MAKRKSFARQLWEDRQRNKREQQRLKQARERHELAAQREQRRRCRDQQRERDAADRKTRHDVREQHRRDAAQKRQYEQILAEQGAARAKANTADVHAAVTALEAVLTDRSRNLGRHHTPVSEAAEHGDITEIGDLVQTVLASSSYPNGVSVGCRTLYKPEAGELLIDCELPRQDVVPSIAGYRYIRRTRNYAQPHERTPTASSCTGG